MGTLSSDPSLKPGWRGLQHGEGFNSIGRGSKEWEVKNYMESRKVGKHSRIQHSISVGFTVVPQTLHASGVNYGLWCSNF